MKILYNYLLFAVAAQIVCYLFWAYDIFGGKLAYPFGDISAMQGVFNVGYGSSYDALIGIGGAVGIGLAGLLLRQGVYALYAMLLWGIGTLFGVVRTFLTVIPNTIGALLPPETNPFAYTNGVFDPTSTAIHPVMVIVMLLFSFGAWWYFFGLVIQRDTT